MGAVAMIGGGRRNLRVTFTLLLLSFLASAALAGVIGVDLGSEFMKVSLVKPGTMMDIVTNIHSKRKTETMISFYQGERSYGADAYSLLTRRPDVTYARLPTLLGRHDDHPSVTLLGEAYFPTRVSYNESAGGLAIHHDKEASFSSEELVAMILTHAKDITKAYGGIPVRDAVLVVPSFYTQPERQALLDAAEIADMKILGLIDENTAAALLFAVDNVYEQPTNIIFYNLGASSLQVSLVEMSSYVTGRGSNEKRFAHFTVRAKAWDTTLGGFQFDLRVAEVLADRFNEKWRKGKGKGKDVDVRRHPKAMAKLRAQAKKVKEVLSANTNIPVHIEGVHDDIDLSTHLSRPQLEELCADLFERAVQPLDNVLQQANLTLKDIAAVEVIGGGVRVPKVQQVVKDRLGSLELSMHLNGDEAMAQGAAFYAANISTSFKVRPIGVTDILPFGVGARLEEAVPEEEKGGGGFLGALGLKKKKEEEKEEVTEKWQRRATIFAPGHKLRSNRTISFNTSKDIALNLTYEASALFPPGAQPTIALFDIRGVSELVREHGAKTSYPPKVFLTFELDASALVHLVKAEARLQEDAPPSREAGGKTEAPSEEEDGEGEGQKEAEVEEEKEAEEVKKVDGQNATAGNSTSSNTTAPAPPKPIVHRKILRVTSHYEGLRLRPGTEEEKESSKQKLAALRANDQLKREKADARNSLEAYLYEVKNKMMEHEEELSLVSTDEQRSAVLAQVEATDDWMYDEGRDVEASVYKERTTQVRALAVPIFLRQAEGPGGARAAALEAAVKNVAEVRALVKRWNVTMPWLTEEEKESLLSEATVVETWLQEKEAAQAAKEGHEEPAFLSIDVAPQLKKMKDIARRLGRKPAPPPPPPPKPSSNKTDENATATNSTMGEGGKEGEVEEGLETVNINVEEGEGAGGEEDGVEEAAKAGEDEL
ncbi:hypothetical protein NSK_005667 [Nannochloropsis salina CCMP1776]|uniref:Uncharacterized protein n=1 Tax=Nannochloropsis salina CCMP1776 TaxID=1027361 RepID=A0A4D9CUW0_9STRA|nr:hypothetical protein NSK_005667 [Nannochloropsis salina CCMP1776]|eukprot:TFJ83042.1 hypothetical protein NSK_005667 [Nannochloropsis salina CCMP1776]